MTSLIVLPASLKVFAILVAVADAMLMEQPKSKDAFDS
jgi:hypothetical protein